MGVIRWLLMWRRRASRKRAYIEFEQYVRERCRQEQEKETP